MDCIESNRTPSHYPQAWRNGRFYYISRVICALTHNKDLHDISWCARHTCDNHRCIRVEHIIPGTKAENSGDMVERNRSCKGESHGLSKLTRIEVLAIRSDPRSQREIAADYGIVQSQVSRIKNRKDWGWL